ncbi:MAG: GntR family transcriptional regulator [Pseudomonadota bacterium]
MAAANKGRQTTSAKGSQPLKHERIAERLLRDIEDGRWTPGSQLPSEEQLADEASASLGTVQRALRSLADMGVVERHHGRGTFVSGASVLGSKTGAKAQERHLRHFRFFAEGSRTLLPVFFKILDVEETYDSGPWQAALNAQNDRFVKLRRIVSVNDEFDIFSELYLPADRFGSLIRMPNTRLDGVSIRDMLAERFNAPTLKTRQTMLCQAFPPRVTRLINVPTGQYGMVWTICGMSYRETPITWQRIFIPPSDRVLEIASAPQLDVVGRGSAG